MREVNICNRTDNKINIIITVILRSLGLEMDITFYKNSREASRKEVALEERSNQLAQQNKLVDYVGLTLKEYFAKIDQAVSLKSPSKRIENRSVGKNEVGESVFTIKLKD